jgi:hypothetical protein
MTSFKNTWILDSKKFYWTTGTKHSDTCNSWCDSGKPVILNLLKKDYWVNQPSNADSDRYVGFSKYGAPKNITKGFVLKNASEKGNYICEVKLDFIQF